MTNTAAIKRDQSLADTAYNAGIIDACAGLPMGQYRDPNYQSDYELGYLRGKQT